MEATAQLFNEDCITGMVERIGPSKVHLTVTSIPFEELSIRPLPDEAEAANLFTYSGKLEDVGNNGSTIDIRTGRFAINLRFVADQLLRVHAAGTNVCIHIQQLLAYKNQHGFAGRRDFRGAVIDIFRAAGFTFHGEVAIPKCPQQMAQRLSLHSLQFKTGHSRNATDWAMAPNDFVLIFQKPGEVLVPVRPLIYKQGASPIDFDTWSGKSPGKPRQRSRTEFLSYIREWAVAHDAKNPGGWLSPDDWIKWARGTWEDIEQIDVLDGWKSAREDDEEKHVCPIQLSLVYRLVQMYTNPITIQPDVTVLDPFMGIGSTMYVCLGGETLDGELAEHRNVIGFELKETYYGQSLRNRDKVRDLVANRDKQERPLLAACEV